MKKSTETLFNAIGGLNDELLDSAIERSALASEAAREETAEPAVSLHFAAETSAPRPRSKKLLRIGLIAAALTLVLGIGVIAEQIRKGLAERIIPVDKEATVIVNEDGTRVFKKLVVDENAPVTKEDLIDRALNTADYYDTISVLFERYRGGIHYSTISIDADLNTAKSYQKAVDYDGRVHESISDGETVTDYVNSNDYSYYRVTGTAVNRLDEDVTKINSTERISIDEYGNLIPLTREEFTNASYALFCINPAREVFLYLNDSENWEITGETEYLGRKAVSASGTAYLFTNEDPNEPAAYQLDFCIDKCTGMLLKLTVSNEDGIIDGVIVKEFAIDQPELTDARIEEAIEIHKEGYLTESEYQQRKKEEEAKRAAENEEFFANYVPIAADPDETLTKDAIYERMRSTYDYFSCLSIQYSLRGFDDFDNEEQISIDTDLRTAKAYQVRRAEGIYLEDISNSRLMTTYNSETQQYIHITCDNVQKREKDLSKLLEEGPLSDYSLGYWKYNFYPNYANASLANDAVIPQGYALIFLTDQALWEIDGECEYLGRKCVELSGAVSDYEEMENRDLLKYLDVLAQDYGVREFRMVIDKLSGILMQFECRDETGELIRETKVTELLVDQPEITEARIEAGIERTSAYQYKKGQGNSFLKKGNRIPLEKCNLPEIR